MVRVLVVAGSPCSGKTTFAAVACAMLNGAGNGDGGGRSGACLVDKDTLEWPLANAALAVAGVAPDSHDCPLYVNTLKGAAYETMERVAEQQVKEARCANVVMVAPFSGHVKDPDWQPRLRRRFFGEGAGKEEKTTTMRTTTTTTTTTVSAVSSSSLPQRRPRSQSPRRRRRTWASISSIKACALWCCSACRKVVVKSLLSPAKNLPGSR